MNQRSLPATDLQSAPFDQTLAFSLIWWTLQESNLGRADLQSAALPTELRVRVGCESGLEPPTSGATNRRSDQLSYSHYECRSWIQCTMLCRRGALFYGFRFEAPGQWDKRDKMRSASQGPSFRRTFFCQPEVPSQQILSGMSLEYSK